MILNQASVLALAALMSACPASAKPLQHQSHHHHPPGAVWTTLAPIGSGPRQEHGTGVIGDDIYIVGGVPGNARNDNPPTPSQNIVERYSTADDTWVKVSPLPINVTHANVAGMGGKLYVLGALTGDGSSGVWTQVPDCFVYDPVLDEWESLAPMPEEVGRGASAVVAKDGVIYLAGGMRSLALVPGGLQDSVDFVTAYDVNKGTWSTLPSLPAPRDHVGGAIVGHTFFVVGGRNNSALADTVWSMDLKHPMHWKQRAPMPTARGGLSIGTIGRYIVTFGGEGSPDSETGVFNNTELYDSRSNRWFELDPMPVAKHGTIAATVGDKIYIPGGGVLQGAGPVASIESFGMD